MTMVRPVNGFGINASAGALSFGAAVESPTNTFTYTATALTVNAGTYTLGEIDVDGYTEGQWDCVGATQRQQFHPPGHGDAVQRRQRRVHDHQQRRAGHPADRQEGRQ